MASKIRDLIIGIGFKINTTGLKEADTLASRFVHTAGTMESSAKLSGAHIKPGIAAIKDADSAIKQVKDDFNQASNSAKTFSSNAKTAMSGAKTATNLAGNEIVNTSNKLKTLGGGAEQSGSKVKTVANGMITDLRRVNSQAAATRTALAAVQAQSAVMPLVGGTGSSSGDGEKKAPGKVREAFGGAMGMFAPQFLLAGGILAAGAGTIGATKAGWDYTKEQSGMLGSWQSMAVTARDEAMEDGKSKNAATRQAGSGTGILNDVNNLAITRGRDAAVVNDGMRQVYMGTGDEKRTNKLEKSILNFAAQNDMTDVELSSFTKYGVGNSFDRSKVTGTGLMQMSNYAPQVSKALQKELTKELGHTVDGAELRQLIHDGKVSSTTLEKALNSYSDKFLKGSTGKGAYVDDMSTLNGALRTVGNGIPRVMSAFENGFGGPAGKALSPVLTGAAKYFTSKQADKDFANAGKALADFTAGVVKLGTAMAPFAGGVWDGFKWQVEELVDGGKKVLKFFQDVGGSVGDFINKSTGGKSGDLFKNFGHDVGIAVGAVSAVYGAVKLFTKLPIIGKPVGNLLGNLKIPGFSKITGNTTAVNLNTQAVDRLTAAMGGAGALGGKPTRGAKKVTRLGGQVTKSQARRDRIVQKYGVHSKKAQKANVKLAQTSRKFNAYNGALNPETGKINRRQLKYNKLENKTARTVEKYGVHSKKAQKAGVRLARAKDNLGRGFFGRVSNRVGRVVGGARNVAGAVTRTSRRGLIRGGEVTGKAVVKGTGAVGRVVSSGTKAAVKGGSKLMRGIGALGRGASGALGGSIGIAMSAFDIYSATKMKPGKERRTAIGGAVGRTAGGAIGAGLGSLLGPVGTVVGGMAGSWLGGKAGEAIGGMNFKKIGKQASSAWNGVKKGAAGLGKSIYRSVGGAVKGTGKFFSGLGKSANKTWQNTKKGAASAGKSISKGLGNGVKSAGKAVGGIGKSVSKGFSKAKSAAVSGAKGVATNVKNGLAKAGNGAKDALDNVKSGVKSGLDKAKTAATNGAKNTVSNIKSGLSKAGSVAQTAMDGAKKAASTAMDGMKSKVSGALDIMGGAWNKFSGVVSGVAGAVGGAINSIIGAAQKAASSIGDFLGNLHIPGFKTGTVGAKQAFSKIPKFAQGGTHRGGLARVNDAPGSTFREAFMLPNGLVGLFPNVRDLVVPLPAGAHVLDAGSTRQLMPKYAQGTPGALDTFKNWKDRMFGGGKATPQPQPESKRGNAPVEINYNPQYTVTIDNSGGDDASLAKKIRDILDAHDAEFWSTLPDILKQAGVL